MLVFLTFDMEKVLCLRSTAVQTAMLYFPIVFSHVVPSVFQHPSLAVIFCAFCLYLLRPARDFCSAKNNLQGLVTAEERLLCNLCLQFWEGSEKPLEVMSGGGNCFFQGTASSITLLLTPAASKGGKGRDSSTVSAKISHMTMICCFFRRNGMHQALCSAGWLFLYQLLLMTVVVISSLPLVFPS